MKKFSIVICIWMLFSCKQEKKHLPDISKLLKEEQPASPAQKNEQKKFRGLFVVGKNIKSFRSCGSAEDNYYVIDSTHQMSNLYKTIFLNSPAFPYEYVYVEFMGKVEEATEAIALRGFDSSIVVSDILTFEQKNYRNTCIPYDFWALGNEPNWSLQV
ncbi:MAG: hypothetical protein WBB36_01970, partial [Chitinophagales bacterium]